MSSDVREVDAVDVSNDDIFDFAFTVDQDADEAVEFFGEEGELGREFLAQELVMKDAALVEFFQLPTLAALEARGVAKNLLCDSESSAMSSLSDDMTSMAVNVCER